MTLFSPLSRCPLISIGRIASFYKCLPGCNRRMFSDDQRLKNIENGYVHSEFLTEVAQFAPPKEMKVLFQLLKLTGSKFVEPLNRKNVNPFLVPIAVDKEDGESKLCYLRWPTQRDTMELQLVRTTKVGVELVALNTTQYCQRLVTELEFYSDHNAAYAIDILQANNVSFQPAGFTTLMKSGKFPVQSLNDQRLLLDRYLLTKIAAFPDCYERLAHSHMENNNSISALVTCERMIALFSSWARPMHFHSKMLHRLGNRALEVKESATAAMGMPLWTLASDQEDLEKAAAFAGYSSISVVGNMHSFRASDPRTTDLGEGVDPMQIPLDQAAHLMDAVTLGSVPGGWNGARSLLADKYRLGGYPAMADFIMAVNSDEQSKNNEQDIS